MIGWEQRTRRSTGVSNRCELRVGTLTFDCCVPDSSLLPRDESPNAQTSQVAWQRSGENRSLCNPANLNYITEVKTTELKSRKASSTSLMPPGIINGMNEDEVRDLLSGGDAKSEVFR